MTAEIGSSAFVITSRSGALQVSVSTGQGLTITTGQDSIKSHDEGSLAEEVEETVRWAWDEYRARLPKPPERRETFGDDQWHDSYLERPSRIYAKARSESELVQVELYGDGNLFVTFRFNAVRRTDVPHRDLIAQLNETYQSASRAYSKQRFQLRNSYRTEFLASRRRSAHERNSGSNATA